MTDEKARGILTDGGALRAATGGGPDDPTLILWLDAFMVMSESVKGWSAGVVEPVCPINSSFLEEHYLSRYKIEVVGDDDQGWERTGSLPRPRYLV